MRIFLDAMGGDNAPQAPVSGAIEALRRFPELEITLAGPLAQVEPLVKDCDDVRARLTLLDAPEVITNHESPVMAVRAKKQSAIVLGMLQVRERQADGFVSAGSTGAVLAGGMFRLGRIPGVERPALAPLMPNGKGHFLLIDCGANVDCKPEVLYQYAVIGNLYAKGVLGKENPRIALLNIGEEKEKGNLQTKAAYELMDGSRDFNFVGNIEAKHLFSGKIADVVVCDGFAGNTIIKQVEGVYSMAMQQGLENTYFNLLNYETVGGTPVLGINAPVLIGHGCSSAEAIKNMVLQTERTIEARLDAKLRERFS